MAPMNLSLPNSRWLRTLAVSALVASLAACGSSGPVATPAFVDAIAPAERLAAVEALGGAEDNELSVQPLRDPQVDDLRQQAASARAGGDLVAAAAHLDQALGLVEGDPGVLQERAELALLAGAPAQAERFARAALDQGSRTGPLCRRHWSTIWQSRLARNEQLNADSARAQVDGCTVPPIMRY
jgi:predicted small lipoprotein YifL